MNEVRSRNGIAVVGIGCRFAKASDLQEYWERTLRGEHSFGPVPADRWDHSAVFDPNPRAADKAYSDQGAFIDDVRSFPAIALQIPPRRVEVMDPQQRLVIECALQAVEDAGAAPDTIPRRTGVYMGVTATEYRSLLGGRIQAQLLATGHSGTAPEDLDALAAAVERIVPPRPFSAPGALSNMIAANISQEFRLTGPAFSVDAACSSALVAIADAVTALRTGQVDAALAGGVYLCLAPDHYVAFSRVGAMSRAGVCRPFDARADGFVQGDGAGVLLLKRVEDAERDGDRIYAVIEGVAVNNDGGGEGPMAPVKSGQKDVIELAWRDAGVDASALGYVEAHGTGTLVGDLVEFDGLNETLGGSARDVVIGSAKANFGHTMSAAGVAGMIRAILAVYHGERPPMAGFEAPKDDLALAGSPFRIPTASEPWDAKVRRACVSAFGFGGTNAHAVLRNAIEEPAVETDAPELVLLSAPDTDSLRDLAGRTADAVASDPRATPAAVARAWARRRRQPARAAIVAADRASLVERLREVASGEYPECGAVGVAPDGQPKIAFLYPGQGSQRVGMLADLRRRFAVVDETLGALDAAVEGVADRPISHCLYPERRDAAVDPETASAELTATENCQPAILACGVALTRLLAQAGVRPDVVAGHSVGEFTAAVAAGVITAEDGARWAATRGKAMADLSLDDQGAMAAIVADVPTVEALLVPGAVVANVNHPRQVVVSGTTAAVEAVVAAAESKELKAVRLDVSHAFHSPVFAGLDLDAAVDALTLSEPVVPIASCIQDHPYESVDEARAVFRRHATSPVYFTSALEQCAAQGAEIFVQVSAGGPLVSFAKGTLGGDRVRGVLSIASNDDADEGRSLLQGLAELWVRGVDVDPVALTSPAPLASVPPTVLPREDYWGIKEGRGIPLKIVGASERPTAPANVIEAETTKTAASEPEGDAAPAPAAVTAEDAIADIVISAVARASAYPKEALKVSMRLADDLGFDSMMTADLAEELVKSIPGISGIPQELLIGGPTIADLIDFARDPGAHGAADPGEDDDAPLSRYDVIWRPAPLPASAEYGGTVQLAGPGDVAAWSEAFASAGVTVVDEGGDTLVWVATSLALPTVGSVLADEAEAPDLAQDFAAALKAAHGKKPNVVVLRDAEPWAEALSGACRALAREWDVRVKAVTVPSIPTAELAAAVAADVASDDRTVDVRLDGPVRQVLGTKRIEEQAEPWAPTADDTVVISGGTRGIGLALAERIAPSGARIVLVGRSAPGDAARALIDDPEHRVSHVAVDVTDKDAVRRALEPFQPVTAFVHAAGVLADGPVESVDDAAASVARAVKVRGFLNTLVAVNGTLKVALAIGSWAGRFGSRHQLHYAAANAMLSELVTRLPARIRSVSSEFGPWTDSEMARTIPEAVQQAMRAEGVDFVGQRAGLDALLEDAGSSRGVIVRGRRVPSTTRAVRRTETLSIETHPYLRDHSIEGHPVLPLAGASAFLAETAGVAVPFAIEELTLFQGVVVDASLDVQLTATGDKAQIRSGDGRTLMYEANVAPLARDIEEPAPLPEGSAPTLSVATFYDEVTFHGPALQGIVEVLGVGDDFARARVRQSTRSAWIPGGPATAWPLDPLVVDSAMQLAAFVGNATTSRVGTPVAFDRYVQLRPMPTDGADVVCEVRVRAGDGQRSSMDLVVRAQDGTLLALCDNVVVQLRDLRPEGLDASWEEFEVKPEWVDPAEFPGYKDLQLRFEMVAALGLDNPYFDLHEGTARDTSMIGGRECINFSSYNYVGLSGDERIRRDVTEAMEKYGTSVSASRIASGERPFHRELEALLAESLGVEDAIVFPSGHATNVTVIGHLFGPKDLILHDELIHDSCLQGIKLAGSARRSFRHEDVAHAEAQLRELRPHYEKVLLLTEGVYSMDGDISNTPEFVRLKRQYGCMLMVDEAHSFGTIGPRGLGIRDHYGMEGPEVDLWMGTMSKSLASTGGWIGGTKALVTYLRYTTPGFVFAAGMTPTLGQSALSALRLMREEPWRIERLQSNARFFARVLTERGLDIGVARGESPVVPVVTGSSMHALQLAQGLLERGINAKPIIYPAVPDDAARLRFFLSTLHSEEQLLFTAETIREELARIRAGA